MTGADLVRLDRRIDGVDETVRALSDSILEIRDVLAEHTTSILEIREVLNEHSASILEIRDVQAQHSASILGIQQVQAQHTVALALLGEQMAEILRRLPEPS